MIILSRILVEFLKGAAKKNYPNEFVGLLREKHGIISEILIIPKSVGGKGFATLHTYMIPMISDSVGTVHSHPSKNNRPSRQDLRFFQRNGRTHIIISYPYEDKDIAVYDIAGTKQDFLIR